MVNHQHSIEFMQQLSPDNELLCAVVVLKPTAHQLAHIDALLPQIHNWDNTFLLLTKHGSAPLLHVKLAQLQNARCIPQHIQSLLQQVYFKSLSRGMLLYNLFGEVVAALQKHAIEIVVLKGAYLSECVYGDIALRQFSDLDLLVHDADGPKSIEVLRGIGFEAWDSHGVSDFVDAHSDFVHYKPMQRGDVSVEIHIKLHTRSPKYKLSISDMWSRSIGCNIQGLQVRVLCLEDLLMHLCIHADKHFEKGEIQLKSFNDIVNLLEQMKTGFDWVRFEAMCNQYRCEKVVFKYFVLVVRYYQAYLPQELYQKYAYCVDADTESRFVGYLQGESFEEHGRKSAVPGHINSLRNIKNPWTFAVYLKEVLFPSKAFMLEKYGLAPQPVRQSSRRSPMGGFKSRCWWLWYVYRWGVGVKGVLKFLVSS